jgi:hypothetical protein
MMRILLTWGNPRPQKNLVQGIAPLGPDFRSSRKASVQSAECEEGGEAMMFMCQKQGANPCLRVSVGVVACVLCSVRVRAVRDEGRWVATLLLSASVQCECVAIVCRASPKKWVPTSIWRSCGRRSSAMSCASFCVCARGSIGTLID